MPVVRSAATHEGGTRHRRGCLSVVLFTAMAMAWAVGGCGIPSEGLGPAAGLASPSASPPVRPLVVFVPGVGGDGPGYAGLRQSLRADGAELRVVAWGAPGALFFLNFQDRRIHAAAERALARRLERWGRPDGGGPDGDGHARASPDGGGAVGRPLVLVGHSAGCGVILGALGRSPGRMRVRRVILLSPSVSPGYDLAPALAHVGGPLHVFSSERDTLFLRWRTATFGTYDNVKTPAAGHGGFTSAGRLPPPLRERVVPHPYDPSWSAWGNDGGHFGSVAGPFVREVVRPLVGEQNSGGTANPRPSPPSQGGTPRG